MSRLCIDLIRTWSLVKAHACTVQTAPKWPISGNTAESEQKKVNMVINQSSFTSSGSKSGKVFMLMREPN